MGSRWLGTRKRSSLFFLIFVLTVCGFLLVFYSSQTSLLHNYSRNARLKNLWGLKPIVQFDKGSRCTLPSLPVNSSFIMKFFKDVPPLVCSKGAPDWVACEGHFCQVKPDILQMYSSVICQYADILWKDDYENEVGNSVVVKNDDYYYLVRSDFVSVLCNGKNKITRNMERWSGTLIGIRDSKEIKSRLSWDKPNGRAMRYNVLMFGFDSLSRNTFIRKLPKSYKYLTEELHCHILEGYNIVGDGTPQALIPILTGYTELELPDTRKRMKDKANFVNEYPLVWNDFYENGYVTAFHEDTPDVGIFTYRLKGFSSQPTDHYMRMFHVETAFRHSKWSKYCNGEIPRHKLMLDYSRQFMDAYSQYPKFLYGFHGELSHDDYNLIQVADNDLLNWMKGLKSSGFLENTIFIMMSDHGHRFANIRDTLQGKQEERLPWFSFVLPPDFKMTRPGALDNFIENKKRLITPFDIHATFLDILGLNPNENYDIHSKFPPRSLSLFGPISVNRTCAQAGIEPHWCACLNWYSMPTNHPLVERLAEHLVTALNKIVLPFADRCATLTLEKIEWAMSLTPTDSLISFKKTIDKDGFVPDLSATTSYVTNVYQIKVRLMPGGSLFEASLSYAVDTDLISLKLSDVSRINKYGNQARCILDDQPQLRKYCYCTRN